MAGSGIEEGGGILFLLLGGPVLRLCLLGFLWRIFRSCSQC